VSRCAPKALEPRAKLRYLRAVEAWPAARDRTIVLLLPAPPAASPADTDSGTTDSRDTEYGSTDSGVSPAEGCAAGRSPGARPPAEVPGLPKYLRLERKELLIWPDQITQLSILACVLNRNRGGAGSG
jgi:hypothetical protein